MSTIEYILSAISATVKIPSDVVLTEETDLLVQLDVDSTSMLEIVEAINRRYEIDLFSAINDFGDLSSPRKMAELTERVRQPKNR